MGRDLGRTGWHGGKHLADGTSEASQVPPELRIVCTWNSRNQSLFKRPSTHCPNLDLPETLLEIRRPWWLGQDPRGDCELLQIWGYEH